MANELIAALERQRNEIEQHIQQLRDESAALKRLIIRKKSLALVREGGTKVTAKNTQELYFWYMIHQMLFSSQKDTGRGLRSREIRDQLIQQGETIKYTTLRSYIHRFSKDGRIQKDKHFEKWVLPDYGKEAE